MRPVFNFFEELFAPGRKHAAEEQKRLELTRVDLGIGDPGRGPIDLASGKVTVRAPGAGDDVAGTGSAPGSVGGRAAEPGAIAGRGEVTGAPGEASGPGSPDGPEGVGEHGARSGRKGGPQTAPEDGPQN
ncbi:DUF6191 domain-containing protein [Streptomyces sp. NPDC015032]|uniref:DUF6191 domain-containing protein n=1 Tax=Streptomyces sp. NPDC015032 TaxID=3364937 RepID=UPI00370253BD